MKEKDKFEKPEKFDKRLTNKLNSSATAKSWSDLLPIMKDVLSILTKNNDFDFNDISEKKLLSKRLAQGLNPECPGGLHEIIIDIYEIIFKNIMSHHDNMLMDNLYYYAYGLFPFFPNASNQNKGKIIDKIIKPVFLKLNKDELKLCLPGLLSSLIPGLEDNEQMIQSISRVFDSIISNNNGEMEKDFYGVYWTLLLRCEHLRKGGILYLLEKIIKYSELQEEKEEMTKKALIAKQFPNINLTIVNALCEIIKNKDNITVRNGMEFIMSRLPLTKENDMITDDAKINLIISGLRLLIRADSTTIRRLKNWILGVNEQDDDDIIFDSEDMKYKMNLVIQAIKFLFDPNKNYLEKELCENITTVKNLFGQVEEFINLILPDTAYTILKCVVNFWEIELDCSEKIEINGIIQRTKEFFEGNQECYDCLWNSLANSINELSKEGNFNSEQKIYEVLEPLKFCLIFFNMKSNDNRIQYYFPLITNLLGEVKNISINRKNFKKIRQIALIILALVKSLQESKFHNIYNEPKIEDEIPAPIIDDKDKQLEMEKERINQINAEENKNNIVFEIYDKIEEENDENTAIIRPSVLNEINEVNMKVGDDNDDAYNICEGANLQGILKNQLFTQLMNRLSNNITKFQEYYIEILKEYSLIGKQANKFEVSFFRQCAELIIRLQEYSQEKENEIPDWIKYIEKIIFQANDSNNLLSIEAAQILLDLNLSSSLKSKIFEVIKKDFKIGELDKDIISSLNIEDFKKRINVQNNCFELLLGKFYLLSNKPTNQTSIMELLLKLYLIDKNRFTEIINETFKTDEYLIENINLFNNFWKLVNEYYPNEKFFEKAECILKMVDLLDDKNPVLRHLSKSWLNQANQCYDKIIDPIIQILLDNQLIFEGKIDENAELITKFDSNKILKAFTSLKNIMLTCQIFPFLKRRKPAEELISKLRIEYFENNKLYYPQTLVSIALHYIKTKSKDNLDKKFEKDVLAINAASCEFLEFLLNNINDPQFLIDNNRVINITIINLLKMYLKKSNEEVMPVQLLDVLKALYFNCPLEVIKKSYNKAKYINIIKDGILINTLITGMTNENFYIREHFLSFAQKCIETYISIITIEDKDELQNFYSLCNRFIQPLSNNLIKRVIINNEEKNDAEKFSLYDRITNNIIFKNYCEEYKEYKIYDENDILSILNSIKVLIKNCFKNEILEKTYKSGSNKNVKLFSIISIPFFKKKALRSKLDLSGDWISFKKELVNGLKTNNTFISFLTSAIIDYTDKKPNKEITEMPTNLYDNQISIILKSFLTVWINQSDKYELIDYCLNPNGILAPPPTNLPRKYLNEEQIRNAKENIKSNEIVQYILDIAMNLFITDSIKFIESIIDLWCSDNNDNLRDKSINDKQFKLSIIELLITMDIPIDIILFCVGIVLQNKIVIKKDIYKKVGKDYQIPLERSIYEAKIFHFLYSYILLSPNRYVHRKYDYHINEIWKELCTILNNTINGTKIIYTYCWMYEFMRLCSAKFFVNNIDKETKLNIENIFNSINSKLMDAAISDKLECKYLSNNILVLPILPHIYNKIINNLFKDDNLYQKNLEGTNKKKIGSKNENNISASVINNKNNLSLFLSETVTPGSGEGTSFAKRARTSLDISLNKFNPVKEESNELSKFIDDYIKYTIFERGINKDTGQEKLKPNILNQTYQRLAFIMIKENFYPLVRNLFLDNFNITKKYYTDLINKLLYLIKGKKDKFKSQFANELLAYLMEKSPKNIYNCAKLSLMEYIKSPQLFNVTQRELHESKIIISKLADEYQDILKDLLNEMNDKNFFIKNSDEDKRKILRRVSFVIYSCEKDKFNKNFSLIRNKAIELLTDYTDNNLLEGEIFLIMRMLFLRFSHEGVMQMIRDLWPIIFTELIQNILDNERNQDFNLLLESFKFVELLTLVNIDEFSLYQWIFMLDTYDMNDLDLKNQNSLLKRLLDKDNKLFRPLSIEAFAGNDVPFNPKKLEGEHKGKNELYIIAQNAKTLKEKIKKFFYSIGDMNSYKVEINYEQIEDNIENDFLSFGGK